MHPISHLLSGWALAAALPVEDRTRRWITWAAMIPDLDGLGVVGDLLTAPTDHPLTWYDDYHHTLAHNLAFGLALTLAAAWSCRQRTWAAVGVFAAFHLHLLGDLVGSKGPDGYHWPLPYLWPFSHRWVGEWSGQWGYKAWPNTALSVALMALALYGSWKWGRSPVGCFSRRADDALTATLRQRFGEPA